MVRAIQSLIYGLESLIEAMGHEPERRGSMLDALGVRFMDADKVLAKATRLAADGRGDTALQMLIKLIEVHPTNTPAMDLAAELLAEMGDGEGAKDLLLRSVELDPDRGPSKYVLLGHLEHGKAAIESFERGLELLKDELDRLQQATQEEGAPAKAARLKLKDVKKRMSGVMASEAKVYLTECFEEEDSERHCEALLDRALLFDAENPEACQALADLRMSQGRSGEALMLVRRVADICRSLPKGLAPTFDFRMVTARLLVELSQYADGEGILEGLAREDPEDTEAWYLLGLCCMMNGEAKKAREALLVAKRLLEAHPRGDAALASQVALLLSRRTLSEEEKTRLWNPRWWLKEDGTAAGTGAGATPEVHTPGAGGTGGGFGTPGAGSERDPERGARFATPNPRGGESVLFMGGEGAHAHTPHSAGQPHTQPRMLV